MNIPRDPAVCAPAICKPISKGIRQTGGKRYLVLLTAAAAAVGFPAFANSPTWTNPGTLTYLEALDDGTFLVGTSSAVSSVCTSAGGAIYFGVGSNGVTSDGVKAIMAVALSALMAGKTVQLLYDATGPTCWGTSLQINP